MLAALLALAAHSALWARQSDRSKPIKVEAQSVDAVARPNGVSHLKGKVLITQGTLKANSAEASVHFDGDSRVSRIMLSGQARIQQQNDAGQMMSGQADRIDYDITKGVATLTGNARVNQAGRGKISGNRLVYNTASGAMTAHSQGDHRVHMVFQPQQKPAAGQGSH